MIYADNNSAARLLFCCLQGMGYACRAGMRPGCRAGTGGKGRWIPIIFPVLGANLFVEGTGLFSLLGSFIQIER